MDILDLKFSLICLFWIWYSVLVEVLIFLVCDILADSLNFIASGPPVSFPVGSRACTDDARGETGVVTEIVSFADAMNRYAHTFVCTAANNNTKTCSNKVEFLLFLGETSSKCFT